jgi:hypothetical protein
MPSDATLRILVLSSQPDVWCEWCGVPSAVLLTCVVENGRDVPVAVSLVAYCEGCEEDANRR